MFNYKVYQDGKKISENDEEILVTFLKMLDFSAQYLSPLYNTDSIKFCPEAKEILICDLKKHEDGIENIANSYGFNLKIQ